MGRKELTVKLPSNFSLTNIRVNYFKMKHFVKNLHFFNIYFFKKVFFGCSEIFSSGLFMNFETD